MIAPPKNISSQLKSFGHALRGLIWMVQTQPHARFHACATIAVLALGLWLHLDVTSWLWLAAAATGVWMAEGFNTALEALADAVHPEQHPLVGRAKDVAAGAVLVAALFAALVAALVLFPALLARISRLA